MARVLVVDDERGIRVTFDAFLAGEGHEVFTAESVEKAKEVLHEKSIDVVVTDMILPQSSGMDLLSFLRDHDPSIQNIVITGEPTMESVVHAMRLGAFDYRSKPVSGKELVQIVRDAARKKEEIDTTHHRLRESREKLRLMAENLDDVIWMTDEGYTLTFLTPSVQRLFGISREEGLGQSLGLLLGDEALDRVRQAAQDAVAQQDPVTLELTCQGVNDKPCFLETTVRPFYDEEGNFIGYLGVLRDVGERRMMERSLRESEHKFRSVVENSLQGMMILQGEPPRFVFANQALANIYGGTLGELVGMSGEQLIDLVHPDDRMWFLEDYRNRLQGWTSTRGLIVRIFRKDGSLIWAEMFSSRITYEGRPAVQASVVDITRRKLDEEQLQRFNKVMDTISDGVVIMGLDGRIIDSNRSMCETYGVDSLHEALGQNALEWFVPEDRPLAYERVKSLEEVGSLQNQVYRLVTRKGKIIPLEVNSSLIRDSENRPVAFTAVLRDISSRLETERTLRANEEKFHKVFSLNPMAMAIISLEDGSVLEVNDAFIENTQLDRSELTTFTLHDFKSRVKTARWADLVDGILEGKSIFQVHATFTRDSGEEKIALVSAEPMELNQSPCTILTINDITELENAQKALRESEQQYRLLNENISDIIWIVNLDMVQTYLSPSVEPILGYTSQELMGKPIHYIYDEESQKKILQILDEELRMESNLEVDPNRYRQVELRAFHKNGEPRYMEINARFMRDSEKQITGIVGVTRDVTKRRLAEQRLDESRKRFQQLSEAMFLGLLIFRDERILEANEAASRITGYSRDELCGMSVLDLLAEESHDAVRKRIANSESGRNLSRGLRKDQEPYWIESYSQNIEYEGERARVTTFWDITEERKAVEDAQRMQKQLLHWQKMEAVGQLAGSLAHDYNNLLTGIIGNIELAMMELTPGKPVRRYLEESRESVRHAVRLTRQLQEFGKGQSSRKKAMLPHAMMEDMKGMLIRVLGNDIRLNLQCATDAMKIQTDAEQMEQLFFNLALNAKDAMTEGGTFTIRSSLCRVSELPMMNSTPEAMTEQTLGWLWEVSDTGCGMDEEVSSHAFEPFYSTKAEGRGSGLGLAMVYGIVRRHDGLVSLSSKPGQGTTVKVWIPCMVDEQEVKTSSKEANLKPGSHHGRILVVEDESTVRIVVEKMLLRQGYAVTVASDARQALELMEQRRLRLDLLISDVLLPGLNGRELASLLMERQPDLKVIYMSGFTDEVFGQEDMEDESLHFISKPFEPSALLSLVDEVMSKGADDPAGE